LLVAFAVAAADELGGLTHARGGPEAGDRHVEGGGDPLDRAHARAGQAALDLAEEGMRKAGLLAEALEGEPSFTA
jgi:hypothetical protein